MAVFTITPRRLTLEVLQFCREVSLNSEPVYLAVEAHDLSEPGECFANVRHVVEAKDGVACHGWIIWLVPGIMIEAEFHAVWRDEGGILHEVTPALEDRILFLPDPKRVYHNQFVDNIRKPLLDSPIVREHIRRAEKRTRLRKEYASPGGSQIPLRVIEEELPNHSCVVAEFERLALAKRGRNDPCPCGSGKKFKNCCLDNESPR